MYFRRVINDTIISPAFDTTGNIQLADSTGSIVDSIHQLSDTTVYSVHSFITQPARSVLPVEYTGQPEQWFLYVLLALALIVSVIWYYIPERLSNIFSLSVKTITKKTTDTGAAGPGIAVTVFFLVNSLITTSFLLLYIVRHPIFDIFYPDMDNCLLLGTIAVGLTVFSLLKLLLVRLSGFLFTTGDMAQKQQFIYFNSYNAIGVILLPLLFILLILGGKGWLYFILFVVACLFIYRWIQIVIIGMQQSRFNTFHLILYLCTLEIIPLVILLKIFL